MQKGAVSDAAGWNARAKVSSLLQVALNGARTADEHPGIPRTPDELARAARASIAVGARLVHLHAYDESGRETLAAGPCAAAVRAVRAACPGIPISLTTSAAIEPDPRRRLNLLAAWTDVPDLVTANQGEDGILELCALLSDRGVGIEAGLLRLADAEAFVRSGISGRCVRVLVEPLDADPERATAHAAAMEDVLAAAGVLLEQIHHGDGVASWAVNATRALTQGTGFATGLEDDPPSFRMGGWHVDNADLVQAAVALLCSQR